MIAATADRPIAPDLLPAIVARVESDLERRTSSYSAGAPQMARLTPREWAAIKAALRKAGAIE